MLLFVCLLFDPLRNHLYPYTKTPDTTVGTFRLLLFSSTNKLKDHVVEISIWYV